MKLQKLVLLLTLLVFVIITGCITNEPKNKVAKQVNEKDLLILEDIGDYKFRTYAPGSGPPIITQNNEQIPWESFGAVYSMGVGSQTDFYISVDILIFSDKESATKAFNSFKFAGSILEEKSKTLVISNITEKPTGTKRKLSWQKNNKIILIQLPEEIFQKEKTGNQVIQAYLKKY